ncbi:hypothetical protein [Trinickia sp.]|uniref:hypothetical protein n=1 Tax=Trinickia sp. TaxID=2571163 RepID=UPI003F7D982D
MRNILCKILLVIVAGFALSANAESLRGRFATNRAYTAEYSVIEAKDSDGMRIERVAITVYIEGNHAPLTYTYDADDYPSVQANPLGFLSIIVNSGGMEGHVTYNYLLPFKGLLESVGTVQTSLHLGKVESIDVEKNVNISSNDINEMVLGVVDFNSSAFRNARNPYVGSAFLLFGEEYQNSQGYSDLMQMLGEKEIVDDPVFYNKLRSSVFPGGDRGGSSSAGQWDAVVISDRANLFDTPSQGPLSRAYLIKGDRVSVVSKSVDGKLLYIIYKTGKGGRVTKWVRCNDVSPCK